MGNPKLKNRVIPNSAVDKILYDKLREYSKEINMSISRLVDDVIYYLLKKRASNFSSSLL